jgi:hypothetical protein
MNDLIAVEKIAEWQRLKALVLDSVSSPITRRVYNMALFHCVGPVPVPTVASFAPADTGFPLLVLLRA